MCICACVCYFPRVWVVLSRAEFPVYEPVLTTMAVLLTFSFGVRKFLFAFTEGLLENYPTALCTALISLDLQISMKSIGDMKLLIEA